jgi:cytochrome c-type protein NapC/trimethylamine-N-oxide reductase cytochrome c-type subunit TorC
VHHDREKNRQAAYDSFTNDQCQKCHRNILYMPHNRGAMMAHRTVLYDRSGRTRKCVDCHRDLVHVDRPQYRYKQFAAPYRASGLADI